MNPAHPRASTEPPPPPASLRLQDMTNMIIEFPDSASADERSSLVVGMFLIEFTVMELRRQNNNNGGGGGGGAPPTHKEMER